jgi:hypothetical protein
LALNLNKEGLALKKLFIFLGLVSILTIFISGTAQAALVFDQGFETDTTGWYSGVQGTDNYGTINMVASGTNGITASSGGSFAIVQNGSNTGDSAPFTRFDGYRSTWTGGFTASVDIYLDTAWSLGSGFDYSVAANGTDGNHRRDFIFHVALDSSTGKLLVAGDNNSSFATREDLENVANHYTVTDSGWYKFEQKFYDSGGSLAVDLNLYDSSGNLLFTETRHDSTDLIPSIVGGNRYGWFTFTDVAGGVAIDNAQLNVVPIPPSAFLLGSGLMGLGLLGWRRQRS